MRPQLAIVVALVAALAVGWVPFAQGASAGISHSCAVLSTGKVKCWGDNSYGQLGHNDDISRGSVPSDMGDALPDVPLGDFEAETVYTGDDFNCAISFNSTIKCWGLNSGGQLGLGDNDTRGGVNEVFEMGRNLPTVDVGSLAVVSMNLGSSHACVVLAGGILKCWGLNEAGQLGYGDSRNRGDDPGEMGDKLANVYLGAGVTVSSVALGARHTCALVNDGGIKCWGNNDGGQLGYEDMLPRGSGPKQMGDNLPFVDLGYEQRALAVSAGAFHTCALLETGNVKCWGFGEGGQLGQGNTRSIGTSDETMGNNLPPIDLGSDRRAIAVAPGGASTCAVLDDHSIKCWGSNVVGSLGLGDNVTRGTGPGEMGDNLDAVDLTFGAGGGDVANAWTGTYHTCVSGTLGGLACFGLNSAGQLGAGVADNLGDEVGETRQIKAIDLGTNVTVESPDAPGEGVVYQTISPTPVPMPGVTDTDLAPSVATSAPVAAPEVDATRQPVVAGSPTPVPASLFPDSGPSGVGDGDGEGDGGGGDGGAVGIIAIASAAILVPVVAIVALCCCWRRRKQKRRIMKGSPVAAAVRGTTAAGSGHIYSREDSVTSSEHNLDGTGDTSMEVPLNKSTPRSHTSPIEGDAATLAGASIGTIDISSEGLPRPAPIDTTITAAAASDAPIAAGTGTAATAASAMAAAAAPSDDDDSSWGGPSDAENPSELRRTGSNSSISTLDSTSTASSHWPSAGFVTPARTEIARGSGGSRPGAASRGRVNSMAGSGSAEGFRTPASLAAATPGRIEPDTPSPRSATGSAHGTPHPPEMRLAQFARAPAGESSLYGLPEMEVGRSSSAVFDSNADPGWPVGTRGTAPLIAAAVAAPPPSTNENGPLSPDDNSPTMGPTLTPARFRHRAGEDRDVGTSGGESGRRGSGRRSNRSSATSGTSASPTGDGGAAGGEGVFGAGAGAMGAEAAAQAFTEEAELEALQIDKDDLKLVSGRPFARGKSSEVYQITHSGKNRAAKIIDLFSLGVVGHEVTRLYASFAQELRAMKGIRHDCVAAVYGAVATPSELTIVTDLVKRGPLRAILDDKSKRESLTAPTRHRIIKDVAAGMAYLSEQGVQHRNLHSDNVLITKEWGAKVADYGLAGTTEVMVGAHERARSRSRKRTRLAYRAGTLRWTAPELLKPSADGGDPFTEASDVYSLGVIAWEVFCGGSKLPYDGVADDKVKSMILEGSTPPVSMETPITYNKLMLLCWRKNPTSRPSFSHIDSVLLNEPPPGAEA